MQCPTGKQQIMIIPIFQPLGSSTHMLAKKAGKIYGEKATHTGTLDPMAKGVVIIMTGDDRFDKEKFNKNNNKTYKFEILFGVTTDSQDILGLNEYDIYQKNTAARYFSLEQTKNMLEETLPIFIGKQQQTIPKFSAKRIDGKSYFDKAKNKEKINQKKDEINIESLRMISFREIEIKDLQEDMTNKLSLVKGNFRQNQVKKNWDDFFIMLEKKGVETMFIAELYARVSKRTYIRGLVRDISQRLGIPATTLSIFRVKNGSYGVKDCVCLV